MSKNISRKEREDEQMRKKLKVQQEVGGGGQANAKGVISASTVQKEAE